MKVTTFAGAIEAAKYLEEKMSPIISNEMSDTIANLRKFLCKFGGLIGGSNFIRTEEKPPEAQRVVEGTTSEYKFSWSQYLKKDLKENGPSTINEIFERFFNTQQEVVDKLGEDRCRGQLRAGAFHLKRIKYLTKEGEGRSVKWTPTEKLMN
jgi:hypothetical protein